MKYDEVDQYLSNLETEFEGMGRACGTHIGFYLTWLAMQSMVSEALAPHAEAVRQRKMTGRDLLMAKCDDKLTDSDLNARGNAFTQGYYDTDFFPDYMRVFGIPEDPEEAFFQVEDTWENYEQLAAVLDTRLRAAEAPATRPDSKEVLRDLEAAFRPVLESLGFQRSKTSFDKTVGMFEIWAPWGDHTIALRTIDRPGFVFGLSIGVSSRLKVLAKVLLEDCLEDGERMSSDPPATTVLPLASWFAADPSLLQPWPKDPTILEITDRSRYTRLVAAMGQAASVTLPMLLRPLVTVQGYDAVYNTKPRSASRYFNGYLHNTPLLCAEMVGNPRLLELCDETEAALAADGSQDAYHVKSTLRCIERIRARAAARRGK